MRTSLPVGTVYASNVAFGGMPVGNDTTGDGSFANPFLTIDKAFTTASAAGTIALNCGPAGATYRHATLLTINKSISIYSVFTAYRAKICATTGTITRVINVTGSGITATIGNVEIDGEGTYSGCVTVADVAATITLNYVGTKFSNWLLQGHTSAGTVTKLAATFTDCIFSGGDCRSAIYHTGLTVGGVSFVRGSITMSAQNLSGHGGVILKALATSVTASVVGTTFDITLKASLVGNGTHYAVQCQNIANVAIGNCTATIRGAVGNRQAEIFQVTASNDANAADSSGAHIYGNTATNDTVGGMCYEIGTDDQTSAANGLVGNAILEGNYAYGTANSEASVHGYFNGNGGNSIVRNNFGDRLGLGLVDKEGNGASVTGNAITRCKSSYLLLKGALNGTYSANALTASSGYAAHMCDVEQNTTTGNNSSGGTISGNFFANAGGASVQFIGVAASQSATFSANDYQLSSGTLTATPWNYSPDTYATRALWTAGHESDATGNMP